MILKKLKIINLVFNYLYCNKKNLIVQMKKQIIEIFIILFEFYTIISRTVNKSHQIMKTLKSLQE